MFISYHCPNCKWESEKEFVRYRPLADSYHCPNCDELLLFMKKDGDTVIVGEVDSYWDRGAYKTSREPKFHKPIKPPEEEKTMDANEYCCRACIYCRKAEFPFSVPEVQFICKRRTVEGELINQYPDQLDDRLDEEHNWCGDGKWWYDINTIGSTLLDIAEIMQHEKIKKEKAQKS